jgi:hypothetical protein
MGRDLLCLSRVPHRRLRKVSGVSWIGRYLFLNSRGTMETRIAVFRGKGIRKTIHNNEWWFSVVDVCVILTESNDPGAY